MKEGLDADSVWSVLAEQIGTRTAPFLTYSEGISLDMSGEELHAVYLRLYRKACHAMTAHTGDAATDLEVAAEGETKISYNLAMTKNRMVVCPRINEGAKILSSDGDVLGTMALNGTVLAGTALIKSELEWAALKKDPDSLLEVLKGIGLPSEENNVDLRKL